jgi:hypothetical protein
LGLLHWTVRARERWKEKGAANESEESGAAASAASVMDVLALERPVTQMTSPAKGFSANSSVENRDNVCKAAVCSLLGNRSRKDDDGDGEGVVERIAI